MGILKIQGKTPPPQYGIQDVDAVPAKEEEDDLGLGPEDADTDDFSEATAEPVRALAQSEPEELEADDIKIESGIPIPSAKAFGKSGPPSRWRAKFSAMEEGDSFFVAAAKEKLVKNIRSVAKSMGIKIAQRAVVVKGIKGVRVWHQGLREEDDGLGIG